MGNNNKTPINVYIILGEANMKKSSVIRCLSGIHNQGVYKIKHMNGNIQDTFIMVSSLQETGKGFTPSEFEEYVTNKIKIKKHYDDILICLRIKEYFNPRGKRSLQKAEEYINHFSNIGWNIIKIVELKDSNKIIPIGNMSSTLIIKDTKQKTANDIASNVRNHFNWI